MAQAQEMLGRQFQDPSLAAVACSRRGEFYAAAYLGDGALKNVDPASPEPEPRAVVEDIHAHIGRLAASE